MLVCVAWQVLTQVIEGEGIGWLKLNRVRKLMEDENYRMLVVSGLNRTLERKIGPDDHISEVVSGSNLISEVLMASNIYIISNLCNFLIYC